MKLTSILTSEKNRYQNCLTWSNLQIASVVSDVFGKSAQEMIKSVLDNPQDKPDLAKFMHKKMKANAETLNDSMTGNLTVEQIQKLKIIKSHFDAVTFCQNNLDQMIQELGKEYEKQRQLVQTVPGLSNPLTALRIISEVGIDMTKFPTAGHLCSWAGLVPRNDESAGKKHSTRITKGGRYIKPLLVEVVVRFKNCPEHRNKYLQLKRRRGHKKAIIAIARRLLVALYHILLKSVAYDASLYHVPELKQTKRKLTIKEAVLFAQRQGFQII